MAILTYHHVGQPLQSTGGPDANSHEGLWVAPGLFAGHLEWLRNHGYAGVTLDEIHAALSGGRALPGRWVCITFDDGWRDNYTLALPLLKHYGFPATVFLITSKIRLTPSMNLDDEFLSVNEIAEMKANGIKFESHTRTHPKLTKLDDNMAREELADSRREMKEQLGLEPRYLAYPYGAVSPRIADIAREVGYAAAVSVIRDNRLCPGQLFWLPRVMIMPDTMPTRMRYLLSPMYHWVHAMKNRSRWKDLREHEYAG